MKTLKNYIYILAALVWATACKPTINPVSPDKGTANFTRYIAVGNSLTAGYANQGLYLLGQQNSYPSIIAKQMQSVGGGVFNQPLFPASQASGSGYLTLTGFNPTTGSPITATVPATAIRGSITLPVIGTIPLLTKYTDDIENYGVPSLKVFDITNPGYGNANPYYERLLPGNAPTNTTKYLDFINAKPFTFFTNWLGNNDALLYAVTGGAGDVLTDKATFNQLYNLLINTLTAGGQKGAVGTIPDVSNVPYFTTVTVGALLAGVQKVNPAAMALYVSARNNTTDADNTHAARVATANDLIVLGFPTSMLGQPVTTPYGVLPYGLTPYTPIDDQYVLDANEVSRVKDYVNYYNTVIKTAAAAKGLAVFDSFTFLNMIKTNGYTVDGINITTAFISGGVFSLDGVHFTPRGYAIIANEYIKAINAQYGSTIPLANVASYNGLMFP